MAAIRLEGCTERVNSFLQDRRGVERLRKFSADARNQLFAPGGRLQFARALLSLFEQEHFLNRYGERRSQAFEGEHMLAPVGIGLTGGQVETADGAACREEGAADRRAKPFAP